MGLDLLDVLFRLERQFSLKIPRGDLAALFTGRQPPDVTAGELHGFVCGRLWGSGILREPSGPLDRDVRCSRCDYNLRGLPPPFLCPECGAVPGAEGPVWAGVCRVLSDATGVDPDAVRFGTLLRKDLGVT